MKPRENLSIPQSKEMERALVGSVLVNPASVEGAIKAGLTSDCFLDQEMRWAWTVIEKRHHNSEAIDTILVFHDVIELAKKCDYHRSQDDIIDEFRAVSEETGSGAHTAYYAAELVYLYQRRELLTLSDRMHDVAHCDNQTFVEKLSGLGESFESLLKTGNSDMEGVLVPMEAIIAEEVEWLWPDRFAVGKLSIISGHPGLGKSFITMDMAARVSSGREWPDGSSCEQGGVLIVCCEDGLADTVRPRLDAAHADCTQIKSLAEYSAFDLQDVGLLERMIKATDRCRLVVLDPISAYIGKADSHNNAEVRALLKPIAELAEKLRVAIVAVSHLSKRDGEAILRTQGSVAFAATARSVYCVTKDKDDPTGRTRLFLPAKNNLGPDHGGLAYHLDSEDRKTPVVAWNMEPVTLGLDEAMTGNKPPKLADQAKDWLSEYLADGPKFTADVLSAGGSHGFSQRTLERVKTDLGIRANKTETGIWAWSLNEQDRQESPSGNVGGVGGVGGVACDKLASSSIELPSEVEVRQDRQDRQVRQVCHGSDCGGVEFENSEAATESFEERAAIIEHDGGLSRTDAERLAALQTQRRSIARTRDARRGAEL